MHRWITAAGALLLGTMAAQAQSPTPSCTLRQIESIPMEVYPDHLVLPVSFGSTPQKLVFLMQNSSSGIDGNLAEQMGLHITSMPPNVHINKQGQDISRVALARDVHLGRLTIREMEFMMMKPGTYGSSLAGDLGTDLFQKVDLELDIAGGKFNLFDSDHCPGRAVYWTNDFAKLPLKRESHFNFLRTDVTLDGQPLTVSFNTDGPSRIGMNAMRRLFHIDETSPDLVAIGEDLLGHKTYRYPFKSLTADSLTVSNPQILVYDEAPRADCKAAPHYTEPEEKVHTTAQPRLTMNYGCNDAILGLSVLGKLRLYISRKENMLYVSAAGAR